MAQPGYAVEHQPVVLNGVTELLVHGVGGESAEVTLHEPHPMQVAGAATAGFYRGPDVHGRHRESYSWGGLTFGLSLGLVLLMAHSQGTVLAVAALRQLVPSSAPAVGRVGLVTYGAPLTRLYRRAFPAYFGNGMFAALHETVGTPTSRWRNFHRKSDLIGGPVFTGPDDRHRDADECLLDPSTKWYVPRDPTPPVLGHSSYMHDPSMDRYVEGLAGQFLTEMGTEAPEDPPAVPARS